MGEINENIRYYYKSLNYENRFYTNEKFDFYSEDVTQLTTDNSCSVVKTNSNSWSIQCNDVGIHEFVMTNADNVKQSFNVNIEKRLNCYRWNFITIYSEIQIEPINIVTPGEEYIARLWVVSGEEERNDNIIPTNFEKDITVGLYMNGLTPNISFLDDENKFDILDISFSKNEGYWSIRLVVNNPGLILFEINNNNIHLFNCTIEKTKLSLPITNKVINDQRDDIENDSKIATSFIKLYQNPCYKNQLIAKSDNNYGVKSFIYSIDNFRTINTKFLNDIEENDTIADIIPVDTENLFILTSSNKLYKLSNMKTLEPISIFPTEQIITNIAGTSFCTPTIKYIEITRDNNSIENYNNYYVAYLYKDNQFYFTNDKFESLNLTYVKQYGSIIDIVIHPLNKIFILLMQNQNNANLILIYDPETDTITEGFNFEKGISQKYGNNYHIDSLEKLVISDLGTNELFIYGKMKLFYSPNSGKFVYEMELINSNDDKASLLRNEKIIKVTTSEYGNIAVQTSSNRIFYGSSNLPELYEINSGIQKDDISSTVMFDEFGDLYVVTSSSKEPYISRRRLPIHNEITIKRKGINGNNNGFNKECPIYEFNSDVKSEYFIDIGETISFNSSVTVKSGYLNGISFTYSNNDLLNITYIDNEIKPVDKYSDNSIKTLNRQVQITNKYKTKNGISSVVITPHNNQMECEIPPKKSTIYLKCPPKRNIRFNVSDKYKDLTCDNTEYPDSFKYFKKYWKNWQKNEIGKKDKHETFDCNLYGPPIPVYYSSEFIPTFSLYDGDTYIKELDAEFVLIEDKGSIAYSYSKKLKDTNCTSKPQTWAEMAIKYPYTDITNVWTPANYKSCEIEKNDFNKKDEYQILSLNNKNGLNWKGQNNMYLMFTAIVVDPEYSYCTLKAKFALYVYGASMKTYLQLLLVFGSIIIIVILLIISFFLYKYYFLKKKEKVA
ncbi:hypothetical protein BCR32DRAFT_294796 [Anaeromyces robustus]|uniref:CATSPERD/E C-terminal domain-containing protein n=1 Tax=Anaeromyces robustus TaxID=1754192 RepID=A0A1Y1WZQ1_9FUNG|nr:hypothetical protein BCR32DRAFT_294796 [Anaeromyces robustus]|eukprot:ORX78828.1 hypothetical protein BCR32DRAFT_294796 [Anaeromyces robustus]